MTVGTAEVAPSTLPRLQQRLTPASSVPVGRQTGLRSVCLASFRATETSGRAIASAWWRPSYGIGGCPAVVAGAPLFLPSTPSIPLTASRRRES